MRKVKDGSLYIFKRLILFNKMLPMLKCWYAILVLFLFLFPGSIRAQSDRADSLLYVVHHYTVDNGLPQNSVKHMVFTNDGFLWFTTENGLVMHDGKEFRVHNKRNLPLKGSRFYKIKYDPTINHYKAYSSEADELILPSNGSKFPTDLFMTKKPLSQQVLKDLFFGFPFIGVDGKTGSSSFPYHLEINEQVRYVITGKEIYKQINGHKSWTLPYVLTAPKEMIGENTRFFNFNDALYHVTNDGKIYIIDSLGRHLVAISGDLPKVTAKNKGNTTPAIFPQTGTNALILYVDDHWYYVTPNNTGIHTQLILTGFDVRQENISCAWYDSQHQQIFLGSFTDGLYVLQRRSLTILTNTNKNILDAYYGLIQIDEDKILAASGQAFYLDGKAKLYPEIQERSDGYSIQKDRLNRIFTKRGEFVYCFSDPNKPPIAQWTIPNILMQLHYDSVRNWMWVGARPGLYYIDLNEGISKKETELVQNWELVNYIATPDNGDLWIGTSHGVYHMLAIDKKTWATPIPIKGLEKMLIRSIHVSSPNEVWITTQDDGFYLFKDQVLYPMPTDPQKALSNSHLIQEDKNGFFWIPTNNSLFQFSKKELLEYAKDPTKEPYFFQYNRENSGFLSNEFNGGGQDCGIMLKDGKLAISSMKGIVVFDPLAVQLSPPKHQLYFTGIWLDGNPVQVQDTLDLPQQFDRLRLDVAAPQWGNFQNQHQWLEYRIGDSKDSTWKKSDKESIFIPRIRPGHTTIEIRYRIGFNSNEYIYKNIVLNIPARFHESPWFMTIMIVLGILFIALIVKLNIYRLQRKNKQLDQMIEERTLELQQSLQSLQRSESSLQKNLQLQEKMIASISHDVKSPLKFLMNLTQDMKMGLSPLMGKEPELVHQTVEQLFLFTEKMIQYLKAKGRMRDLQKTYFDLNTLVQEKIDFFKGLAGTKNTVLLNEVKPNTTLYNNKELLGIIIHNLIDNALKFTSDGKIWIEVERSAYGHVITVRDNGKGFQPNHIEIFTIFVNGEDVQGIRTGLGMEIIRELAKVISARIEFRNAETGNGSITQIFLPEQKPMV